MYNNIEQLVSCINQLQMIFELLVYINSVIKNDIKTLTPNYAYLICDIILFG